MSANCTIRMSPLDCYIWISLLANAKLTVQQKEWIWYDLTHDERFLMDLELQYWWLCSPLCVAADFSRVTGLWTGLWTDAVSIWPRSVWAARCFSDRSAGTTRKWSSTVWCTTADAIWTDAYVFAFFTLHIEICSIVYNISLKLVLLWFQNVSCWSVSVGFAEKTSVFGSV